MADGDFYASKAKLRRSYRVPGHTSIAIGLIDSEIALAAAGRVRETRGYFVGHEVGLAAAEDVVRVDVQTILPDMNPMPLPSRPKMPPNALLRDASC
jgi:hypothetical protein